MEGTLPLQSLDLMLKISGETSLAGSFPGLNEYVPSGGGWGSADPYHFY